MLSADGPGFFISSAYACYKRTSADCIKNWCYSHKRSLWDPVTSGLVLLASVIIYTEINAFVAGDNIYQGGFKDLTEDWNQTPVVGMQWTKWNTACPEGWQAPPFRDGLFHDVKDAKPVIADQKKLCVLRNGLVANAPGEFPRPRTQCAQAGLQVCMQGKYPYCGKQDTPCPLVDVKDFAEDDKSNDMRHVCLSHIPTAYLPWTGCRPITDVVVSSDPPCFKYSVTGVTRTCVLRDTRYRFLKSLPFASGTHVARTPDTGVYYRNEIFYNPKCHQKMDLFEAGALRVSNLVNTNYFCLLVSIGIALYAGLVLPVWSHHGGKTQKIHLQFRDRSLSVYPLIPPIARAVLGALLLYGVWGIMSTKHYFIEVNTDKSCVDPLVGSFIEDFVHKMLFLEVAYIGSAVLVFLQIFLDLVYEFEESHLSSDDDSTTVLDEAAPLFRPLPEETEADIAARNGIKYVYCDKSQLAALH